MHVLPLFRGAFSIVRKDKEHDQKVLRTALKQADQYGFRITGGSNATHLNIATLSKGNDQRLQDTFAKHNIEFKYSPDVPATPAQQQLAPLQRLGQRFQHSFIKR